MEEEDIDDDDDIEDDIEDEIVDILDGEEDDEEQEKLAKRDALKLAAKKVPALKKKSKKGKDDLEFESSEDNSFTSDSKEVDDLI